MMKSQHMLAVFFKCFAKICHHQRVTDVIINSERSDFRNFIDEFQDTFDQSDIARIVYIRLNVSCIICSSFPTDLHHDFALFHFLVYIVAYCRCLLITTTDRRFALKLPMMMMIENHILTVFEITPNNFESATSGIVILEI